MNGLRIKLDVLRPNIHLLIPKPDIIVFTGSSLHESISDSELGLADYTVYKKDRFLNILNVSWGGGAVIAALNKILINSLFLSSPII